MSPALALLLSMLLWSTSFIAAKYALQELDPEPAVALRLWIATLLTLPWALRGFGKVWKALTPADRMRLVLLAGFEPCLYFLAEMNALLYTTAGAASLVMATLPVWIALGARIFLGEHLGRRMGLAILISLAGSIALTLFTEASEGGPRPVLGNLLMVLAMLAATGYVLLAKRLLSVLHPWWITRWQAWLGALFFTPWLLKSGPELSTLSLQTWFSILWLGSAVTLGAYGLYNLAMRQVSAQTAGIAANLIPVFTVILAWWWLDETLSPPAMVAALVVLGGVTLAVTGPRSKMH